MSWWNILKESLVKGLNIFLEKETSQFSNYGKLNTKQKVLEIAKKNTYKLEGFGPHGKGYIFKTINATDTEATFEVDATFRYVGHEESPPVKVTFYFQNKDYIPVKYKIGE